MWDAGSKHYDEIGIGYRPLRQPDARIQSLIHERLGDAKRIVNLGAGAGSYEPTNRSVVAVEPSRTMLAQRRPGSAPAIEGRAESLPFPDRTFDVATGFLTVHHWNDWRAGLAEAQRVAERVLLLTWNGYPHGFWLMEYFPEIEQIDADLFPALAEFEEVLGPITETVVPIPRDCTDGFLCAYWARPEAYLREDVRRAISAFAYYDEPIDDRLARLQADLESGAWAERYGPRDDEVARDFGYRLIESRPVS